MIKIVLLYSIMYTKLIGRGEGGGRGTASAPQKVVKLSPLMTVVICLVSQCNEGLW